jgi:predicted AlkP superfamily pyrophosphatase or phosphodiesterase
MLRKFCSLLSLPILCFSPPVVTQKAEQAPAFNIAQNAQEQTPSPKLVVVISVDQFSADLFAEYRGQFTAGLKRLQDGAVFPAGYQSHAATETCPGHSTILTGDHPSRTGIVANDWMDLSIAREDKTIYCAEDPTVAGSNSRTYTVSDKHLKVPTLGERMKAANPATRVVSVAGKDRAAVMMGGHHVDELWWWDGKAFASYAGRKAPAAVTKANASAGAAIAAGQNALDIPGFCASHSRAISIGNGKRVGDSRFARKAGDARGWRASPAADVAALSLAADLIDDMQLGKGSQTDIISIGASATDYIGHTYGTGGSEQCIQMFALDRVVGTMLDRLDKSGIDYVVALTADHGGHDLPERIGQQAITDAKRVTADLATDRVSANIAKSLKLKGKLLYGGAGGDIYLDLALKGKMRAKVLASAVAAYRAHPLVAAVFTKAEIAATLVSASPPESWNLIQRARASFDPLRSGDFYVILKPRITPIVDPGAGYVATHGSAWDYDRRVPVLFWRAGMARFEQPLSVETVDIAPTLAAMIGLAVPAGDMDGRCLDLDAGPGSTCK